MGEDADIVTVAFPVLGEEPAKDLENFVEKGYPFVLDADVLTVNNPTDIIKYLLKWKETKSIHHY